MIKIDLSSVVPKRLGAYLLGVIPGTFFLSSIVAADSQLAAKALTHVEQVYKFPSYGLLIIALLFCLMVGQVFFLVTWIIDMVIQSAVLVWLIRDQEHGWFRLVL
jgi:hypothetical protein